MDDIYEGTGGATTGIRIGGGGITHRLCVILTRNVPGLGEKFCDGPGTEFVCSPYRIYWFLVLYF